jgi:hypothetical protein
LLGIFHKQGEAEHEVTYKREIKRISYMKLTQIKFKSSIGVKPLKKRAHWSCVWWKVHAYLSAMGVQGKKVAKSKWI